MWSKNKIGMRYCRHDMIVKYHKFWITIMFEVMNIFIYNDYFLLQIRNKIFMNNINPKNDTY